MKINIKKYVVMVLVLPVMISGTAYTVASVIVAGKEIKASDVSTRVNLPSGGIKYGEKPKRIRMEERQKMKEESHKTEQVGREVERLRDIAEDKGEDINIEKLKAKAEEKLFRASQEFSGPGPKYGSENKPSHAAAGGKEGAYEKRVCFKSDGSVTENREECDHDQGRHFGMDKKMQEPMYGPPPQEFNQQMEHRFEHHGSPMHGPPLLDIVGDALHRLSGAMEHVRGTESEEKVREAIVWLSSILADYAAGEPEKDEKMQLASQIYEKLSSLQEVMGGGMMPGGPGGYMPPVEEILEEIERIMEKLPKVIAIFERENIPVAPEAKQAYEGAKALFEEIKQTCSKEDPQSCDRIHEIFMILEEKMRPPMEKALMASGKMEVMKEIEEMMGKDGGPPPGPYPPGPMPGPGPYPQGGSPWDPMPGPEPYPYPMPPPPPHEGPWEGDGGWDPSCPDPAELDREWEEREKELREEMEANGESTEAQGASPWEGDSRLWHEKELFYMERKCDDSGQRIPPEMYPPPYEPPSHGAPSMTPYQPPYPQSPTGSPLGRGSHWDQEPPNMTPYQPPYPQGGSHWDQEPPGDNDIECEHTPEKEKEWDKIQEVMKIELREKEKTHEEIEEILRKKKFEHFNCGPMPQPHPVPSYPEPPKDGQYPLPGQYYPPMPGPMPMPYPDGSMPDNEYPKPEGGNVESQ